MEVTAAGSRGGRPESGREAVRDRRFVSASSSIQVNGGASVAGSGELGSSRVSAELAELRSLSDPVVVTIGDRFCALHAGSELVRRFSRCSRSSTVMSPRCCQCGSHIRSISEPRRGSHPFHPGGAASTPPELAGPSAQLTHRTARLTLTSLSVRRVGAEKAKEGRGESREGGGS